ncbi:hypothetical protein ASPACDRAFT_48843, partial [Aspergillus aculeatus ATCC 16872]
ASWRVAPSPGGSWGSRLPPEWRWAAASPPPGTYPGRGPRWAPPLGPASWRGGRKRPSPRSAGSRASLQGPVCMGKRPDARTTPYRTAPLGIASAPSNVCTPSPDPT